ncbi:MAG: sulfotransferase [Chloroflexi bacterium]|nr:sulfotransferase [Chloroflexota bacterium]
MKSNNKVKKRQVALIIAGHPRSGTGLLQTLCTWHPEMAVTSEFGNYTFLGQTYVAHARNIIGCWQRVRGEWAIDSAFAKDKQNYDGNNLIFTLRYLFYLGIGLQWRINAESIETAYRRLFPQADVVGDKWPDYLFELGKFTKISNLKRIVIYRDCRDVTSSFLKKSRSDWSNTDWINKIDTAEKIASRWVTGIKIMEAHSDKIFILQYESLMRQPEHELIRMGEYLGVDPAKFPGTIKPGSIGKYQEGLTDKELETIMEVAGPTMERLGYLA